MNAMGADGVEAGWSTTEFWVSVISAIALLVRSFTAHDFSPEAEQALAGLIVVGYTLARAVRKSGFAAAAAKTTVAPTVTEVKT